jgi:hypothetical protein
MFAWSGDAPFADMAQQKVRAVLLSATPYYQVINDRLVELPRGIVFRPFTNGARRSWPVA